MDDGWVWGVSRRVIISEACLALASMRSQGRANRFAAHCSPIAHRGLLGGVEFFGPARFCRGWCGAER